MTKSDLDPVPDLKKVLPERTVSLLEGIGEIAGEMGAEAYLVGGLVRDMFLGVDSIDLDIAIVGDGLAVARRLAKTLNARILAHERFLTATLVVPGEIKIDVATARSERYERPGALPTVAPASLAEDLFRRDITINAMAASLIPGRFGTVLDPYGGVRDLRAGLVRILHPASLLDDPTRMLRIIRFAARFGFQMEEKTRNCLKEALQRRAFEAISADRLRAEIFLALNESDPGEVFRLMSENEVLAQALPGIIVDRKVVESMLRGQRIAALVAREQDWEPGWVGLILLMHRSARTAVSRTLARLNLQGRAAKVSGQAWRLPSLGLKTVGSKRQSELHAVLGSVPFEMQLALLAASSGDAQRRRLLQYVRQSRTLRPELTGEDLKALGYPAGPRMKRILAALTAAKLDGELRSRKKEEAFVLKNFPLRNHTQRTHIGKKAPRADGNARG